MKRISFNWLGVPQEVVILLRASNRLIIMKIRTSFLSITNAKQKTFPFSVGELISGKILSHHPDGSFQVLLMGQEFKAKYHKKLEGNHLFKVLQNREQLVLKLMPEKTAQPFAEEYLSQFTELSALAKEPFLQQIILNYIKYNLVLQEKDILLLYRLLKKKEGVLPPGFIGLIATLKAKRIRINDSVIQRLLEYHETLSQTETELSHLLKKEQDPVSQYLRNQYLISLQSQDLKSRLKEWFSRSGYQGTEKSKGNSFFILDWLKFASLNSDNNIIERLINQFQTEKESYFPTQQAQDFFYLSLPILKGENDDRMSNPAKDTDGRERGEVNHLKLKVLPKYPKGEVAFFFEITLSQIKNIRGFCLIEKGKLHLRLETEQEQVAEFLKQKITELYCKHHFPLGSWKVIHIKEKTDFLCETEESKLI